MMKKRGSITVFLALLLTCVFSTIFAFLEAARVSGLKANTQLSTMQARDTVLASYDRFIWRNYHLLFWQAPEGDFPELGSLESLQQAAVDGNRREAVLPRKNYYMLQVHLTEVKTTAYQFATDDGGAAFRRQAAEMMKETVGEDALRAVLKWIDSPGQQNEDAKKLEDEALNALEQLQSASGSSAASGSSSETMLPAVTAEQPVQLSENPLEWVKMVRKNGIYALVMPEEEISGKSIDLNSCIGNRVLQSGNMNVSADEVNMDKLLFRLYLSKYFYDVSEKAEDHALDYELEYMIIGKGSDEANLKGVIRRLMLIREVSNLTYLETNAQKKQEAALIASALVAAVGQPELEPVVQQGVLAAWAYAESISDIRILLEGGKVSLLKTDAQWHTQISCLSTTVASTDGEKQAAGLSYSNYLQLLMWTTSDKKMAERAMDMIEKNTGVQMDRMVCGAKCEYVYEASPLFWNFVTLGQRSFGTFQFTDQADISFLFE